MPYITVAKKFKEKQISIWDMLEGLSENDLVKRDTKDTITFYAERVPLKILTRFGVSKTIDVLRSFNERYKDLYKTEDKHTLFRSFKIPKRSGGFRQIDAPNDELMAALHVLKSIFENQIGAPYHTSAFAYVGGRSTLACMQRHQSNNSRWFAKFDFSKFFPSTTPEFVMKMLSDIFPYNELIENPVGKPELEKALSLCFLDGHLPQGTPMSPLLTNIMMIPIDLEIARYCREHKPHLCYTRYADDICISSEFKFDWAEVQVKIKDILEQFGAPFKMNSDKTRFGSSAGRNWNLGLMLNKDGDITVGYKKKKLLKATVFSFMMSDKNGQKWELGDLQELLGQIQYCRQIEKEKIDDILRRIAEKFEGKDVIETIKLQMKP